MKKGIPMRTLRALAIGKGFPVLAAIAYAIAGCTFVFVVQLLIFQNATNVERLHQLEIAQGIVLACLGGISLYLLTRWMRNKHPALQQAQQQLRMILDHTPAMVYMKDMQGRYILVNRATVEGTGIAENDFLGKTDHQILSQDVADKVAANDREIFHLGQAREFEEHFLDAQGKENVKLSLKVPLFDDSGAPYALCGISTNITPRMRMEADLAWMASFPRLSPSPVVEVHEDGRVWYANPAAQQLFPDLTQSGPDHPWLADWGSALQALREGRLQACNREVVVGERSYFQSLYYCEESGTVRVYGLDVTERKRAEQALRKQQVLMDAILEKTTAFIYVKDADGRFLLQSRSLDKVHGVAREDIVGKTDYDIWPKELADTFRANDLEVMRSGKPRELEEHYMTPDGERTVFDTKVPLLDEHGKAWAVCGISTDITERKLNEKALAEALRQAEAERARLQAVMDELPVGVSILDPTGGVVTRNAHMIAILGGDPERKSVGDHAQSIGWHPATGKPVQLHEWPAARTILNGETIIAEEFGFQRPDGERSLVLISSAPISDNGTPAGAVVVAQDITERRRTERALREHQTLLQAVFDNTEAAILVKDLDGRRLFVNRAAAAAWGMSPEEMIGKTCYDLTCREEGDEVAKHDRQVLETLKAASFEELASLPGGQHWFLVARMPLLDEKGQPYAICVLATDITERKAREDELVKARQQAEAASHAKSAFLANMSHEIRTPMTAVIGMIDLVLMSELEDEQREHLQIAKSAARMLIDIINDILDFSRIEQGTLVLREQVFSVHALAMDTLQALRVTALEKKLGLLCDVGPDVPDQLLGDATRLWQVLVNLVGNAIKFTDHGEVSVQVSVLSTDDSGTVLHVAVADTGIGIPEDRLESIFTGFSQMDGVRRGGTGMGLAISSHLVGLMGGRMWVESGLNVGSTFHFTVRLRRASRPPDPISKGEERKSVAGGEAKPVNPLRVLIVDDTESVQLLASRLLVRRGHSVATASNGRKALAEFANDCYDVILMDRSMPEMDGLETTRMIRRGEMSTGRHVRIIALTAAAFKDEQDECLAAGMDSFLAKPFEPGDLYAAVERSVES